MALHFYSSVLVRPTSSVAGIVAVLLSCALIVPWRDAGNPQLGNLFDVLICVVYGIIPSY